MAKVMNEGVKVSGGGGDGDGGVWGGKGVGI